MDPKPATDQQAIVAVKQFSFENEFHNVTVLWKNDKPMFKAVDVARILGLQNVHASMREFGPPEKSIEPISGARGKQEAVFLTELGLWCLAGKNRKPIGRHFRRWVFELLRKRTPAEMSGDELRALFYDLRERARDVPWLLEAMRSV